MTSIPPSSEILEVLEWLGSNQTALASATMSEWDLPEAPISDDDAEISSWVTAHMAKIFLSIAALEEAVSLETAILHKGLASHVNQSPADRRMLKDCERIRKALTGLRKRVLTFRKIEVVDIG